MFKLISRYGFNELFLNQIQDERAVLKSKEILYKNEKSDIKKKQLYRNKVKQTQFLNNINSHKTTWETSCSEGGH